MQFSNALPYPLTAVPYFTFPQYAKCSGKDVITCSEGHSPQMHTFSGSWPNTYRGGATSPGFPSETSLRTQSAKLTSPTLVL